VKYERLWRAFVFSLIVALTSCSTGNENETITGPNLPPNPSPIGTFSGAVQNASHTKDGTLTISITTMDSSGKLAGSLSLTGFSECFTTGIFPDPSHKNDSFYSPQRGFGRIIAAGRQSGSHSYLEFEKSADFNGGLMLGSFEGLAFYDGRDWCLEIDPALLKRQ
jgi:hypothetical protein